MIDKWLNETIESYFQRGSENRVFLFFDSPGDYSEIIDHLTGNFRILKTNEGLLKIKYQIECEDPETKFVVYLPFSKDSREISYLKEYIYTGRIFSDSLYMFLKSKRVNFPTERTNISEIKKILPTLVVESIGKSEDYWKDIFESSGTQLILPDFREKLMHFFECPDETYQLLKSDNKNEAFQKKMITEYGFHNNIDNPRQYRDHFFRQLCFTEVFYTLKKPSSYPFMEFVSNEDTSDNNIKLIKEIRHHNRYNKKYSDLTFYIEKEFSTIKRFAGPYSLNPEIETFRVFDLEAITVLNDRAQKCENKQEFVQLILTNIDLINKKSDGFWEKEGYIREWSQLSILSRMVKLIEDFKREFQNIDNNQQLIDKYSSKYFEIDSLYRKYITESSQVYDSIEDIYKWIEKLYIEFLDKLNSYFSEKIFEQEKWEFGGLFFQGDFLRKLDLKGKSKIGIIIVDGLRFELGKEIQHRISGEFDAKIEPAYAQIPSDTNVGMALLLSPDNYEFKCDPLGVALYSNEMSLNNKPQRIKYLKSKIEKINDFTIEEFNELTIKEIQKINNPIIIFSGDPDKLGEAGGVTFLDFISGSLSAIIKGIKKLSKAGFSEIHIIADHGFLTFKDPDNNFKISDKPDFIKNSRRYACGGNFENENLVQFNLPNMKEALYFPRSIYYFIKNSFLHGGITVQEILIPYIRISAKKDSVEKVQIQIEMEDGISNRIFEVKIKPTWLGIERDPRTIEIFAQYNEELVSNRPAQEIESKEESIMVRILPIKHIPQGGMIKIIVRDQETQEILDETEKKALVPFEQEDF
ncbi:MAG: PglZ domain-containing protein [Methanosarcinales archaeon]|nr:PglZ domain-containing protein [Methanosarcinales archaeon]